MILATEALSLPSAQLTNAECDMANRLEMAIEEHVRKFMARRGCDFETEETNGNVLAEVNQRLKTAGYLPQWQPVVERNKLSATEQQRLIGFRLALAPTDESYQVAARAVLS